MRSLAVFSDIHGNRWALEAVLEDIDRRGIEMAVNLGDSLYGPLDPGGTADILVTINPVSVLGNEDRIVFQPIPDGAVSPTLDFVRASLKPHHFTWLESLPRTTLVSGDILLCHGTPDRDDEYVLNAVIEGAICPRTPGELAARLNGWPQRMVLCGHDHLQNSRILSDGRILVNPGSIGLGAYWDDNPSSHVVESGSPHARYTILWREKGGWEIEHLSVSYDWEKAACTAEINNRPDWAFWLRTGRVGNHMG